MGADQLERRQSLTSRERELLTLRAGGMSNKAIAMAISITIKTVEFHPGKIIRKFLGARNAQNI